MHPAPSFWEQPSSVTCLWDLWRGNVMQTKDHALRSERKTERGLVTQGQGRVLLGHTLNTW